VEIGILNFRAVGRSQEGDTHNVQCVPYFKNSRKLFVIQNRILSRMCNTEACASPFICVTSRTFSAQVRYMSGILTSSPDFKTHFSFLTKSQFLLEASTEHSWHNQVNWFCSLLIWNS